jgi:hypothetical protein
MNTLRLYTFIALAAIACGCSKTENPNDAYGGESKQYNYFNSPQKIISRSAAEFEVFGWVMLESESKGRKSKTLRLLCKWPPGTPDEKQVYTPANVLVDGYNVGGYQSFLQHANTGATEEDEKAGFKIFFLAQPYMPVAWENVEIQFQGSTPTTLEINNI